MLNLTIQMPTLFEVQAFAHVERELHFPENEQLKIGMSSNFSFNVIRNQPIE